jgi:hypothetical protein
MQRELVPEDDAARWDAQAEYDIGVLISRYLRQNPAPPGSRLLPDFAHAARDLQVAGQLRLDRLGQRRLHLAASLESPTRR